MDAPAELTLRPIGIIRTPYVDRYHAPRQPGTGKEPVVGVIELLPDRNFDQALEDLEGFERIWLLTWFHRNDGWKPKVLPPRSGRTKRGVFATRSPHRPNPLGLSLCRLLSVKGRTLTVADPDLLDGTPILDIKPYLPYAEAFPEAEIGWLAEIEEGADAPFSVEVSALAREQAEWLERHHGIRLLERVADILSHDPFPHSYRRIMAAPEGGFVIAAKSWRVSYVVDADRVVLTAVRSGYPPEVIAALDPSVETLHHQQAHVGFHRKWMSA